MTAPEGPGFLEPGVLERLPRSLAGGAVLAWTIPGGVRLELRRRILRPETLGLFLFASFWTYLFVFEMCEGKLRQVVLLPSFWMFLSPALLMYLWIVAAALSRATFEADVKTVRVARSGLFGTRRREWKETELEDIRDQRTQESINKEPLHVLVFELSSGKQITLLKSRDEASLRAIASELRRILWAPRPKPPASP